MSVRERDETHRQPAATGEVRPAADAAVARVASAGRDPTRYTLLGEHGRGALGRVTRAHDLDLGRDVAIKELISRDEASEARFLREALITARLEHPGIVAVHEAGRWPDGTPFYAMKLVSGRSLRELIAEREEFSERLDLLHHVIAVADAIAYAHRCGVIHRDLKPANVIVGDFGETVVIDWGLAKDLTATDDPVIQADPPRGTGTHDLTQVGAVLGTPAYMAPEQERGEPVDQRADVYAIGVMLWELCASTRVVPADARLRRRALGRAGIDQDLAAIIGKALEQDAARRYPDAGALAHDLKAFKSGARITARDYSLPALIAHWVRRHRAAAGATIAVMALALVGAALYVRNVAIERDRAEAANQARLLEHAEVLLQTDPTAAARALAGYRGDDRVRMRRLVAEAEGRGVAREVLTPHTTTVWFAVGEPGGDVISLGEDRRLQRTRGAASTTLAADVSTSVRVTFAAKARRLAYATSEDGVAVLDLATGAAARIPDVNPVALELSPDGARLATLDAGGQLSVWSVAGAPQLIHRELAAGGARLRFAGAARLIVLAGTTLRAVALASEAAGPAIELADVVAVDADDRRVAVGTADGRLVFLTPELTVIHEGSVCRDRLRMVKLIPHGDRVAYACADPATGLASFDPAARRLAVLETFALQGRTAVYAEASGRYVAMIDESNTAYLYDTATRRLHHYDGNAGRPTFVAAPTAAFPHVLVGDINGTLRVWDPPDDAARIVLRAPTAIAALEFGPGGRSLIAAGVDGVIRRVELGTGAVIEQRVHRGMLGVMRIAPDRASMLSGGLDGALRILRTDDLSTARSIADGGGVVVDADYVARGRAVVAIREDRRLTSWSLSDGHASPSVLFASRAPLTAVEVLASNDHALVADAGGALWDIAPDGIAEIVRPADGVDVRALRASDRGDLVALGAESGEVTVYATADWRVVASTRVPGVLREVVFDPLGRELLVITKASRTQPGQGHVVELGAPRRFGWREVTAPIRHVAYAPDGETIAIVCTDGGTWLYAVASDTWAYAQDHGTEILGLAYSPDGRWIASADRRGVIVLRSVDLTLARAHAPQTRRQPEP